MLIIIQRDLVRARHARDVADAVIRRAPGDRLLGGFGLVHEHTSKSLVKVVTSTPVMLFGV